MRRIWVTLLLLVGVALAQEDCNLQTKCDKCIQTPNCMWCSKFKGSGQDDGASHCLQIGDLQTPDICEPGFIENPANGQFIMQADPLTDSARKSPADGETIVQLKPQKMKLQLRQGTSEKIELTYKQAFGYPIDLYYLMDLSNSMLDDKKQLALLGGQLTATLQNLTQFYTIGFGSFVDKVMMPFVDTHPNKINEPCTGCAKAYSFRNDLPLGYDGTIFTARVEATPISGNLDAPEGGFDALMQVIVCTEQIKWREQARRIIVYSTDAQFHQAGDGKLAGVVIPNDEQCHLNEKGEYDAYDTFDYPSIGQINKVTKDKDIYVIFGVSNYDDLYRDLTKVIENSSWGKLSANSDNLVNLVRDQYNEITSKINLSDNSSKTISIDYYSNCKNKSAPLKKTSQCNDMREGDEVVFNLDVKLHKCPENGRDREVVEVKTLQDNLILEIEFLCDCNCETEDDQTIPSDSCNNEGALVCGVCSCFPGFRGDKCQCSADGGISVGTDDDLCKPTPNATDLCYGRGYCVCGSCDCFEEDFSGKFCHCNRRKCLSNEGEICSGYGTCSCDQCSCISGYTGRVCECQTDDACKISAHHDICSGHGKCDCGRCTCDSTAEATYSGQYCDDCLTCEVGKCSEFHEGVLCRFHNPASKSCNLTVIGVESLEAEEERGARKCSFVDPEDDCMIIFTYRYLDSSKPYEIHVQREKQCPEAAPIMGIVFGILAGIVLIGLLTLVIWKILTTLHDRSEFAKFEKDRENASWNAAGNPLYIPATNTFANPLFTQQEAH